MPSYNSKVLINLENIDYNFSLVKSKVNPNVEITPAVKANSYNIGSIEVVNTLKKHTKVFYTACLDESIFLRSFHSDVDFIVLNGANSVEELKLFKHHKLIPVINCPKQLEIARLDKSIIYCLHYDTAMARLGFTESEFDNSDFTGLNIRTIISHLACSDEINNPLNLDQLSQIKTIKKRFPQSSLSLCNSGGIFLSKKYHLDQVRPGAAIYGINSSHKPNLPIKPVINVFARVLQIKTLDQDQGVGYAHTYQGKKGQRLATIEFGYADGVLRSLSNIGFAYFEGYALPFVGRVSMDLIVLDVTHLPENILENLNFVELLGEHITVNDVAALAGTSGYEVLTSLKSRYKREYVYGIVKKEPLIANDKLDIIAALKSSNMKELY